MLDLSEQLDIWPIRYLAVDVVSPSAISNNMNIEFPMFSLRV